MTQTPNENPLLLRSQNRHGALDFDQYRLEHYLPAMEAAITSAKANVQSIKDSDATPDFENTILALEACSEDFDRVTRVYFNLFSCHADEEFQSLAQKISPMASRFSNDILLDEKLFARVKTVYESRSSENYTPEQLQLVEKTFKGFYRNGALLSDEDKSQLRKIDEELSQLSPKFAENVLKDSNSFELHISDEKELEGLPESSIDAAAQTARDRGKEGWLFTLDYPSFVPFMTYSAHRDHREKMWRAYNGCGLSSENNNQPILKRIAELRHQRANLLGYETHADFVLEERMAESKDNVQSFLKRLVQVSRSAAEKELKELKEFQKEFDGSSETMPWDFGYYSEKLKEKKFKFNAQELRPYFSLDRVLEGMFEHATKLYQVHFKEVDDLPKYHEEVRTYEVLEEESQNLVGVFYVDLFPRATKKSGAWMTQFRDQGLVNGQMVRPHISIVCNFTKPTESKPSLLNYDEVRTLFHEFGHALHGLLSDCTYPSLSGTSVYWDFVELPSQINENWTLEKETLDGFARHFETDEVLPDELMKKLKDSAKFQAGYSSLRQLNFGLLDMAWHANDPSQIDDIEGFESEVTRETRLLPKIEGITTSSRFSHIFSGGYSAGYYSYKWAEVLDADAFEMFKEKGLYNREVARSFKENILSRGGTEHPMKLYERFRGRKPDPDALLRRDGLLS